MDRYIPVELRLGGQPIGWAIIKDGTTKIVDDHFHTPDEFHELEKRLGELHYEQNMLHHWPEFDEPAVQDLLKDETFEPLHMEWVDAPVIADNGKPVVQPGWDENDLDAPFFTEPRLVPSSPVEVTTRIKKAQELVAKARIAAEEKKHWLPGHKDGAEPRAS